MASRQDLRQSQAKTQDFKQLGTAVNADLGVIIDGVNTEFDAPLKMSATFPMADAVLNFSSSLLSSADGANKVISPVKKQIFANLTDPTINFQTQAVSNAADFDISFPISNTVGFFRHVGFTLIGSGKIKALFSAEAATEGTLSDPGALFVSGGLPIGYVTLECTDILGYFKTAGSATNIIENAKISRFGSGSGSGGSGTGVGSGGGELIDLLYQAAIRDSFTDIPDGTTTVDITAGTTDASLHDVANELFRLNYDASITVTGTGTAMTLSGAPAFTIKAGDVLVVGAEVCKIVTVNTQTDIVLEAAFSSDPSSAACCVSQAVHTVDLNAFDNNGLGLAASSQFPGDIDEIMVGYQDSDASGDIIPDFGSAADVAFTASADDISWSEARTRTDSLDEESLAISTPTSDSQLKLRFFANRTSGSGAVNLLSYKVFFHKQTGETAGSQLLSAFARPTSSIYQNVSHGVSGGKSRFQFTWAYPRGANDGEASGSMLQVYANGQRVPRFVSGVTDPAQAYFVEISDTIIEMDTDYSSAGIDFQFRVESTIIDSNTQNTTRLSEAESILDQAVDAQVITSFLTPVNAAPTGSQFRSDISNRASILNPAANLSTSMGVNRIITQNVTQLADEFGPTGQSVYKAINDKFNQIRFVGNWNVIADNNGNQINSQSVNDYVEVVFYGTGLNALCTANSSARDARPSVDGGAEGSNIFPTTSAVLNGRNYAMNVILPVVSNLALGLHTVKIRSNSTDVRFFGFEVLNQSTQLTVNPGIAIKGKYENALAILSNAAYASSFESGTLGTRGGNVVVYLKSDGTIGKAVTPANSSAAYYNSTDHTNEEIVRRYNWREFGANRTDDYSTLSSSGDNLTWFTLDDDTTNLATKFSRYRPATESFFISSSGGFTTITFVGTGLDIIQRSTTALSLSGTTLTVDGVAQGASPWTQGVGVLGVCSGLPYGTHTVRFDRVSGNELDFTDFIVYAPKKPAIPSDAIEISQYYVMADFVANATATKEAIATGTMRKWSSREFTYVGASWVVDVGDPDAYMGGITIRTNGSGNYLEYTFFGTGFEFRGRANTVFSATNTVALQNLNGGSLLTLTTANFPSITASSYGGFSFNSATGNLSEAVSNTLGSGFRVSGLPLGEYKIRITNGTTNFMDVECIDVITPIYAPSSNIPAVFQNTLSVGSDSLADLRKWNKRQIPDEVLAKVAIARGVTVSPTTTSTSDIPMPEMSIAWYSDGEWVDLNFQATVRSSVNDNCWSRFYVNGSLITTQQGSKISNVGNEFQMSNVGMVYLPKGFHKLDVYWKTGSGTLTAISVDRIFTVKKIANN